jgi:hypothetical protein
MLKLDS